MSLCVHVAVRFHTFLKLLELANFRHAIFTIFTLWLPNDINQAFSPLFFTLIDRRPQKRQVPHEPAGGHIGPGAVFHGVKIYRVNHRAQHRVTLLF